MKIRIDMQGVQTDSRHRGIGRYCLALTREFIRISRDRCDVGLIFNGALDGIDEAIEGLAEVSCDTYRRTLGAIRHVSADNPANDARRNAAERVFGFALGAERPDVVWLGSVIEGFSDDALIPQGKPAPLVVATLYDLIPLHDPAEYLASARAREWYRGRLDALKRADLLLAISDWVREDAIARLGMDPGRILSIGAGVDARFVPTTNRAENEIYLREHFRIRKGFVLYNGGFDKRKNVMALVAAFAELPAHVRDEHVLVVVGRISAAVAERMDETMSACGLARQEVIFAGYVSDDDLVRLYQGCSLFVFPSMQEGFGLAPLEAMACGAPTIVNNATSLPEVIGSTEALFDAEKAGDMTARMLAVLTDRAFADHLARAGLSRASHFSWNAVAERAMAAIDTGLNTLATGRPQPPDECTDLPLYKTHAANADEVLAQIRRWPGVAVWTGPLPATGPTLQRDRFLLGGYARLETQGKGRDWLALLEQEAIGVVIDHQGDDASLLAEAHRRHIGNAMALQRMVETGISRDVGHLLNDDDLARVADALDRSRPATTSRWLVDITHIATNDLGTGVHRVVRSVLREWLLAPPHGTRIEPILFRDGRFHHAHEYACDLLGIALAETLPGDIVAITGNEVYIALDWTMESIPSSEALLRMWRRAGVSLQFVVYDVLPLTMPEAFHPQSCANFATWVATIARLGDALHCISDTTAAELRAWLGKSSGGRHPAVASFQLGADAGGPRAETELAPALQSAISRAPSLLMVGTIEPRKGHSQVLNAFELLWEAGADVNLVIVGHRGWLVKELVERLQHHSEAGKRLFWLDDADDATLEAIYRQATALIAASHGEGYGLPLIEAAKRHKPVIARSLPVFREVAGNYPSYFDTETAGGLATHLARWLTDRPNPGTHPAWLTWQESASELARSIRMVTARSHDA